MNRLPTVLLVIPGFLVLLLLPPHCATPPAPDTVAWRDAARDNAHRERDVANLFTSPGLSATDELTETIYLPLILHDWSHFADWGATGDLLGWAVATAGDVNGDGYADVIVGAPRYSNGETEEGAVFLYLGGPVGLAASPAWTGESDQSYAWFGYSIAAAGDADGDGYGDVIVGAPRYDIITSTATLTDTGQAFLYYGGPAGIVTSTVWTTHTAQAHARFGAAVAAAGDVNGDGFGDVIVTANGYDAEQTNEGAAFVYHGGPTGLTAAWAVHPTDQAYANFGRSASTAGDVNRDGYSDVIVGASWYDSGATDDDRDRGAAYVYHGGAAGLSSTSAWTVVGDRREAEFGISVSTAGDVNGDGYSDAIVGAYKYTEDSEHPWREGAVFAYHGGVGGLDTAPAWSARSGQESSKFASSISTAGDMNGDGYADVIVGAYNYEDDQPQQGMALVYYGGAEGLSNSYAWSQKGNQQGAGYGFAVSTAGDVNGDTCSDIIVGAPTYNGEELDEGAVFVHLGDGECDAAARPRQLRSDGFTPIAPLGLSDSASAVHLQLIAQPTQPVTSTKLQWQLAPLGIPFTNVSAISGTGAAWTTVTTNTVVLSQTVETLTGGAIYRWRVRMLYWPGDEHSDWLYLPWNGPQEADFRTP